jgi:hypothetical protein
MADSSINNIYSAVFYFYRTTVYFNLKIICSEPRSWNYLHCLGLNSFQFHRRELVS